MNTDARMFCLQENIIASFSFVNIVLTIVRKIYHFFSGFVTSRWQRNPRSDPFPHTGTPSRRYVFMPYGPG